MTTRQELLDQWHDRLAEAEQDCECPDGPSWSLRVRLRLYRFLLAMYGETEWPGPKDDVDNAEGRAASSSLLVADSDETLAGKVPRTRAEILAGLRNVKGLAEELAPPGPYVEGVLPRQRGLFVAPESRADDAHRTPRKSQSKVKATKPPDVGFHAFCASIFGLMAIFLTFKITTDYLGLYELPSNLAATADSIAQSMWVAAGFYFATGLMLYLRWRALRKPPASNTR